MIVATSSSLSQRSYALTDADGSGEPFGEIALPFFGSGRLVVGDTDYDLETRTLFARATTLAQGGAALAVARSPRFFSRRQTVTVEPGAFDLGPGIVVELVPGGLFGRRWTVVVGSRDASTAVWSGFFRPVLRVDVSDQLPLVVQAFVAAVLVIQRLRDNSSA